MHTLTSSFSVSGVFPPTPRPLLTPALLGSALRPSTRDGPGARTCQGSARPRPSRGADSDVEGSPGPARPADVTAAAVLDEAQGWEFKEGNNGGDPAVRAERCDWAACLGFPKRKGRNRASRGGRAHPTPSERPNTRV